jgi:D-beta-D-heptose 7-phosphate kinase/D-beta-D-heptose 1-phosphate adenosyltransferase
MTLPSLDPRRARELVAQFHGRPILVVGDVMLDRFIVGTVTRISAEAPVPVVRFQAEHSRLGGAANVAHNLATLGAQVSLVGVIGGDSAGERLRQQLAVAGISSKGLIEEASRPTVEKVRIVTGRNQQVARSTTKRTATRLAISNGASPPRSSRPPTARRRSSRPTT